MADRAIQDQALGQVATVGESVRVGRVVTVGLACCGIEARPGVLLARRAGLVAAEPRAGAVNILLVAGTVTGRMAGRIRTAYDELPEPKVVIAFGACAIAGGPYWDSQRVLAGTADLVPVAAWVPGCPPRPADVLAAVAAVAHA